MPIRTELNLRLPNSPGALGGVCRVLSDERVNILAMALETSGQLRLVVDNHVSGAAALRSQHHQVTEKEVLLVTVPNGPGAVVPSLNLLSDAGGNLDYAYASAAEGAATAALVLGVEDAQRIAARSGL